jgi:F-type H+-transporting ATPase subunit alpha
MPVEKQVAVLYCGTHGLLSKVPLNKVNDFEKEFLSTLELTHQEDVLDVIKKGIIDDTVTSILEKTAEEVARRI